MHAVVIGAGAAGLGTALALARDGHEVTIVERDATPLPRDADAAFEWDRTGAPQVRHSHAFLARLRNLLRDRWPDVLERLLAAGATEIDFCAAPPAELGALEPEPGDEDLVAIACRRTTYEWVLRQIVLEEAGTTLIDGASVAQLLVAGHDPDGRPIVSGVELDGPDGPRRVEADVVVAAVGRRSAVPRWLAAIGVEVEETTDDTGILYLSRFYRLRPEAAKPTQEGPIGGDLGYLKYAVFQGDNDTWSITFAVGTGDDELRRELLDADTFDRAARTLPATAPWAADGLSDAITPVHVMGGLLNRRAHLTDPDGEPLVLGFHAVGDAHTCTNPLYGRGCSLGLVGGVLLADALAAHPDDRRAAGRAYEAAAAREIEPWYRAAVAQDAASRAEVERARARRGSADAEAASPEAASTDAEGDDPQAFMRSVMRDGLLPAVRTDAVVFRAFLRSFNLLATPDLLMSDPDLIGRVLAVWQDRDNRPPEPSLGPRRRELLSALR